MNSSGSNEEILDLIRHLKQERLFVSSERYQLQKLNENVHKTAETLFHLVWIAREQRINLESLLRGYSDSSPQASFHIANALEGVKFIDAYKHLSYHESKFSEFLKLLRLSPKLIAKCLIFDKQNLVQNIAGIIISAVYGNCTLQEDEQLVLQIIRVLMETQLVESDDPARLLRRGTGAFCVVYKQLIEGSYSSRLFLTAALNAPVMFLLKDFEWFYDVDAEKALQRFSLVETKRRFGVKGSDGYRAKIAEYRSFIVNKLVQLTECFIASIKKTIYCFPASLSWVVSQMYLILTKNEKVSAVKAREMCIDLIFTKFICPAICEPAAVGITSDVPISYIARHNLMQIATILQVLAISQQQEMDSRAKDVYSRFDRHCLSSLFDPMFEIASSPLPPQQNCQLQGVDRSAVFITPTELNNLITFLQGVQLNLPVDDENRKLLDEMLNNLPKNVIQTAMTPSSTPSATPPGTPSFPGKKSKGKKKSSVLTVEDVVIDETSENDLYQPDDVLVISINPSGDCLGMMSEDKVVQQEQEVQQRKIKQNFYPGYDDDEDVNEEEVQEKRTRFSLSHDQDSLGNTSDNIEAISEACSSHSVESTDSVNGENDNLSDMFSANVSGRETPNISGRDTPVSQAESEEVLVEQETRRVPDLPVTVHKSNREDVTERFQKFDIKTELERQGRHSSLYLPDESKSTVSDTWSTDVLASDSEPPDSNQLDRLEEVAEEVAVNGNLMEDQEVPVFNLLLSNTVADIGPSVRGSSLQVSEMSETASECWSTDVLASDTDEKQSERLLELDQDDSISISSKSQGIEDNMSEYSETGPDMQNLDDVAPPEVPMRPSKMKQSPRPPHRPDNFIAFVDSESRDESRRNSEPSEDSRSEDNVFDNDSSGILDRVGEKSKIRRSSHDHVNVRRLVIPDLDPASPDLGVASMDTTPDAGSQMTLGLRERDSGISETPIDESKDAGVMGTSDLHSSFKSLKLTEQQNTKIDANRLSAAISMFDPIMQESDDEAKEDVAIATAARPLKSGSLLVQLDDADEKDKVLLAGSLGNDSDLSKSRNNTGTSIGSLSIELPKGISFGFFNPDRDEKGGDRNRKSNFFKSFKEKFNKGAKRKSKSDKGEPMDEKGGTEPNIRINGAFGDSNNEETSDDILAKYSKNMTTDPRFTSHLDKDRPIRGEDDDEEDDLPAYDPNNLENCRAFRNAKKKLRMVFSTADFQTLPCSLSSAIVPRRNSFSADGDRRDNEVVALLRMQQAEAINLQDKELVAQLQETIRCVRMFDHDGIKKLLRTLKDEYKNRSYYISYLVKCRQNLLATQSHLERLIDRVRRDKEICHKHFISTCVHRFLQKRENSVIRFMDDFHKLTMPDEKTDLVEQFLDELYNAVMSDVQWQTANEIQIEDSQLAIERMIMNRIYSMAMFPNGDGDITRDKILHEHIKKLSAVMIPSNPYLRIPKVYHSEAPWVSAQEEIKLINAYKTPKDKVQCVVNTSATIMNLLSMACEKSVPAADDFIPILIFVVIKANPPHLLSNVQYVNSFYQKRIEGEEHYWWMQFSSAIEFIKTMEYSV